MRFFCQYQMQSYTFFIYLYQFLNKICNFACDFHYINTNSSLLLKPDRQETAHNRT